MRSFSVQGISQNEHPNYQRFAETRIYQFCMGPYAYIYDSCKYQVSVKSKEPFLRKRASKTWKPLTMDKVADITLHTRFGLYTNDYEVLPYFKNMWQRSPAEQNTSKLNPVVRLA